jgi:hypothetical protein
MIWGQTLHGITVNSVAPGTFAPEVNAHLAGDDGWARWLGAVAAHPDRAR